MFLNIPFKAFDADSINLDLLAKTLFRRRISLDIIEYLIERLNYNSTAIHLLFHFAVLKGIICHLNGIKWISWNKWSLWRNPYEKE